MESVSRAVRLESERKKKSDSEQAELTRKMRRETSCKQIGNHSAQYITVQYSPSRAGPRAKCAATVDEMRQSKQKQKAKAKKGSSKSVGEEIEEK